MIEIAFTESACGSLKLAQSFGKGKYREGCVAVIVTHDDGSEATEAEIQEAERQAQAQQRLAWEQAVPLGGQAGDVFGFPLALSFGDIRDPMCVEYRLAALKVLFNFWDPQIEAQMCGFLTEIPEQLAVLRRRVTDGEAIRIWYSDIPDELCGFYWLMDALRSLPEQHGTIYAVKQPVFWESDGEIRSFSGWGEIEPGQFHRFTELATPVSDDLRRSIANAWRDLQQENALIRAGINGRLRSAPEDLYDLYIQAEIDAQPEEFREAIVVGNVLGKYQPGIGDGYIHHRIDKLVQSKKLIAVTSPKEGDPGYWRILRKA